MTMIMSIYCQLLRTYALPMLYWHLGTIRLQDLGLGGSNMYSSCCMKPVSYHVLHDNWFL